MLVAPRVAGLSCDDCRRYVVSESWDIAQRGDLPVLRPKPYVTPCGRCPKIPRGDPPVSWAAQSLTPRHERTYAHYLECKAVGIFPDDALVRRNASWIRQVEESIREAKQGSRLDLIAALLTPKKR